MQVIFFKTIVGVFANPPFHKGHQSTEIHMEERFFELETGILKAFAQPTRLKILEFLRSGEKSIHEVVSAIHGEQSNVSRHISLMQKRHIVTTRKDGVRVMVKVADPEIFTILDRVSRMLRHQLKEQEKLFARI